MKFSTRLSLFFILAASLFAPILGLAVYYPVRTLLQKEIISRQERATQQLMANVDQALFQVYEDIEIVAAEDLFGQWLTLSVAEREQRLGEAHRVAAVLEEKLQLTGPWDSLFLVDLQRRIVIATDPREHGKSIDLEPLGAVAYEVALSGKTYYSDVVISEDTGLPTVLFAAPLIRQEEVGQPVVGVVIGHFAWYSILQLFDREDSDHQIHLFNRDGTVIATRTAERQAVLHEDLSHLEPVKRLQGGERSGSAFYIDSHQQNEAVLASFSAQQGYLAYEGKGWGLLCEVPQAKVLTPVRQLAWGIVTLVTVLLLLVMFAIVAISKQLTRPIVSLTKMAQQVAAGNLDLRTPISRRYDEIGLLSTAFNSMLDDLEKITVSRDYVEKIREQMAEAQRIAHIGNWEWDVATNLLHWSDEVYRIFGLAPHDFEATYEAFIARVHPDDREEVKAAVTKALLDGRPYSIEHRILRSDGSVRVVHELAETVLDEAGNLLRMIGTVHDISVRKEAEKQLRASEEFIREILDTLDFSVAVLDRTGVIIAVNEPWRFFARQNGGAEGLGVGSSYLAACLRSSEDEIARQVAVGLQSVLDGKESHFQIEYPCDSPTEKRWFLLHAVAFSSRRGGLIVSHLNITGRREAEEQLQHYSKSLEEMVLTRTEELEQKKVEAELANRAKSQFLANMSHELKTPLNAIIGFSDLLLKGVVGELAEQQRDFLADIRNSGGRLAELVEDMLDVAAIDTERKPLTLVPLDLSGLLQSMLVDIREKYRDKDLQT
ncbi:MAG: PAS domain-containing protein, partial [Proteobacteria bacterium]|nr:PAS domain S-box protein [Desulfobulbaceae bacterium]MBU4151449.1 PAS domain-containing protein [Pseudomonadota bacterium]